MYGRIAYAHDDDDENSDDGDVGSRRASTDVPQSAGDAVNAGDARDAPTCQNRSGHVM